MTSGVVADTDGSPIEKAPGAVYGFPLPAAASATTDPSGSCFVGPLTASEYRIEFTPARYVGEWLTDQLTAASATRMMVSEGAPFTEIDASPQPLGPVEGTIRDEAGCRRPQVRQLRVFASLAL